MPRIKPHEIDKQQYDFVIVGGNNTGTIGLFLTLRN